MKKKYIKTRGLYLLGCFILCAVNAAAQTNNPSEMQNNAEAVAQAARSNADARAEYRRLHPTQEELEWATNVAKNWKPAQPWPDAFKKSETLTRSANVLRLAIDTNQIEMACNKMTNQPERIAALRNLSVQVISNLDVMAGYLTNSSLYAYDGEEGCQAEIQISSNPITFSFWSDNHLPTFVRDLDERTPDSEHVLLRARFYENGKLFVFTENVIDSKGNLTNECQLILEGDGRLRSFRYKPAEPKQ